mgnify:CR=1 FL=1
MAKLLPPVSRGGSLAKISKPTTGGMSSPLAGRFLNTKKKVITLDTLFKDRVDREKKSQSVKAKLKEREQRDTKETKLEKQPTQKEAKKKSTKTPGVSFLDKVKNFIGKTILGFFVTRLVDSANDPRIASFLDGAAAAGDFIINFGGKIFDGLVTFLDKSYEVYDGLKGTVGDLFGDEGLKQFEDFSKSFVKVANYTLITAMAFAGFGETAAKAQKALIKKVARPAAAAAVKGVAKFVGKGAARVVLRGLKLAAPVFKKIPIIGPLLNFLISYYIFKEPVGKAALRAVGSAIGTALGGAIGALAGVGVMSWAAAPIGGFLGGVGGDYVGGWLYDAFFDRKKDPFTSDGTEESPAELQYTPGTPGSSMTPGVGPSSSGPGIRNQSKGSKMAGELGRYLDAAGVGGFGSGVHQHPEHPPWPRESGHRPGSLHYESQGGRAIDIGGYGPNLFRKQGLSGVDDQTQIIQAIMEWEKQNGLTAKDRAEFAYEGNDPIGHADHVHIAYRKGGVVPKDLYALLHKGEIVVDPDSAGPAKQMLLAINEADSYESIVKAIGDYAPYDALSPQTIVMSQPGSGSQQMYNRGEGSVSYLPVPSAGATSSPKDILYKGA